MIVCVNMYMIGQRILEIGLAQPLGARAVDVGLAIDVCSTASPRARDLVGAHDIDVLGSVEHVTFALACYGSHRKACSRSLGVASVCFSTV